MKARSEPTTHNRKRPQSGTVDTEDAEDTEDTEGTRTQQQHCGPCRVRVPPLRAPTVRCRQSVHTATAPHRHTAHTRCWLGFELDWSSLLAWSLFR